MRRLYVIVCILLLAIAPSCKFLRSKGLIDKQDKSLAALLAQQDSIRVADSIRKVQAELMALENSKLDSATLAQEAQMAKENNRKYNIIVGSFLTPEYAKGFAEVYRQQGYDSRIIKMDGSSFELVAAESHVSFGEALTRLKEFQDTVEIDAWMYIKK
jgi:hypothetical protein